jgi:hypothetical protein
VIATLKGLILDRKIDRALNYIIINTLGGDCLPFTQKSMYLFKLTKNVKV